MSATLIVVYAALLGAVIGSFLNVCVHRWPLEQSVVSPRSRCPRCGNAIAWYDNIPIASWLMLRGRCRHCAERISWRYPAIELLVALIWGGAMFAAAFPDPFGVGDFYFGLTYPFGFGEIGEAVRVATFLTILLGIALTDAEHYIIPDEFSLGGLAIGVALAFLPAGITPIASILGADPSIDGLFYATGHFRNGILLTPVTADAVSGAILGEADVDLAPYSAARFDAVPAPAPAPGPAAGDDLRCDLCGSPMYEVHCKVICRTCGYKRDCSDLW